MFRQPTSNAVPLDVQPRLESWEGRDHPSQTALQTYLDHVEDTVGRELVAVRGDAAVSLDVGLPHDRPLTGGGGDLDNFLYPVVRRLGPSRFAAAWATKKHGRSSICAQSAVPASRDLPAGWRFAAVRTTKASESRAWKQEVAGQLPAVEPSLGAVELQLCFRVAPQRNWATLWKPAIDALGTILGVERPENPFNPRDDRVTSLGLHRNVDDDLRHTVEIGIWWRSARTKPLTCHSRAPASPARILGTSLPTHDDQPSVNGCIPKEGTGEGSQGATSGVPVRSQRVSATPRQWWMDDPSPDGGGGRWADT